MCFTIPKKITAVSGSHATLEGGGNVDISALSDCSVGDYVLITSGIAVTKLTPEEGIASRSLIKETYETLS